jgi:hypothetical protein
LREEYAQLTRPLIETDPRTAPKLARALRRRAGDLIALSRVDESLVDSDEAIGVSRWLLAHDENQGYDELAWSLRVAAEVRAAAGRFDDAVDALRGLQDLATERPTALRAQLVWESFAETQRQASSSGGGQVLTAAWQRATGEPFPE